MAENKYNLLAIVPARSKSKGIPNKNITYINKTSLLQRALKSSELITGINNTCLTTDSETYIKHAQKIFSPIILKRSDRLSSDTALALEVWQDTIKFTNLHHKKYKFSIYLEPTSPLRNESWIEQNIKNFIDSSDDLWMSVKETDSKYRLEKQFEVNESGKVKSLFKNNDYYSLRQNSKKTYHKDGVFYIAKNSYILKAKSLFEGNIKAIINEDISVNIDTIEDLEYAKFLLRNR